MDCVILFKAKAYARWLRSGTRSSARNTCAYPEGANMAKAFGVFLLLSLAACSGVPQAGYSASPCSAGEASYACQVQRYHDVSTP
jgi:hypothetical protein